MIFTKDGVRYFVMPSFWQHEVRVWKMTDSIYDAFFNRPSRRE